MTTRIYYVNIDLRHQYGISVAESQTFLLAKRPKRQGVRKNGCFRRLTYYQIKITETYLKTCTVHVLCLLKQ